VLIIFSLFYHFTSLLLKVYQVAYNKRLLAVLFALRKAQNWQVENKTRILVATLCGDGTRERIKDKVSVIPKCIVHAAWPKLRRVPASGIITK